MHELSLAMSMRDLIEEQAKLENFSKVNQVVLEVGELSHVQADAMAFCFESAMAGSVAEDAELIITSSAAMGLCPQCNKLSAIKHLYDPCPHCHSFGMEVIEGNQVRIISLEVI